jgi:hypothetical protein
MAGTLTISTLSDGTYTTSATNLVRGPCVAWVNFNGTNAFSPNPSTSAIRASYNVSSITRNSTADYTVNMTNALVDDNYSVTGLCRIVAGGGTLFLGDDITPRTTLLFRVFTITPAGALVDASQVNLAVFR